MRQCGSSVLVVMTLMSSLGLAGCAQQQMPASQEPPLSRVATIAPDPASIASPKAVIDTFLEASNAGDGATMNALYGPEAILFGDSKPASRVLNDWTIGAATDKDGPLEVMDASGTRRPAEGPQPERIVVVPVRVDVGATSGHFAVEKGPATFDFTLFTMDGKAWRIDSIRIEQ